jgi:hypothetical protein
MTSPAISRFDVPEFQSLPQDIQNRMTEIQEKAGFIPNVFLVPRLSSRRATRFHGLS